MQALRTPFFRAVYELLSSMRFAISLLTVLAIASVIGTVLKQNEPYSNYLIELGPFWFKAFSVLGLYDVYHAGWFLGILTFLVFSVSVCIYRQTPRMLHEIRFHTHFSFIGDFATTTARSPAAVPDCRSPKLKPQTTPGSPAASQGMASSGMDGISLLANTSNALNSHRW